AYFGLQEAIDRHGNTTTFQYATNGPITGALTSITDPRGVVTIYNHDSSGRLSGFSKPGPNGAQQTWTIGYGTFTCNTGVCGNYTGSPFVQNGTGPGWSYTTVTSLTVPDGRGYTFSYDYPVGSGTMLWGAV